MKFTLSTQKLANFMNKSHYLNWEASVRPLLLIITPHFNPRNPKKKNILQFRTSNKWEGRTKTKKSPRSTQLSEGTFQDFSFLCACHIRCRPMTLPHIRSHQHQHRHSYSHRKNLWLNYNSRQNKNF